MHTGAPNCPCGCSREDAEKHTAEMMMLAVGAPDSAVSPNSALRSAATREGCAGGVSGEESSA